MKENTKIWFKQLFCIHNLHFIRLQNYYNSNQKIVKQRKELWCNKCDATKYKYNDLL